MREIPTRLREQQMTDKHVSEKFSGFVIIELMGHRRLAGFLTVDPPEMPGLLRIDIPAEGERPATTQYYATSAVYAITPTTETVAIRVARASQPAPVNPWELRETAPALPARAVRYSEDEDDDDDKEEAPCSESS